MENLNLSPDDLLQIKTILKKIVPTTTIWAYGSRVNGTNHESSDLDLVLLDPEQPERPCPSILELKRALQNSHIPILIDIMDWAVLSENFQAEIKKNYVIIQ